MESTVVILSSLFLLIASFFGTVLFVFYIYWWYRNQELKKDVHKFVCPLPPLPVLGHSYLMMGDPQASIKSVLKLITPETSPSLIWVGPWPFLVITRPEDMAVILTSPASTNKGFVMKRFLAPWMGNGLILTDNPQWKLHRRFISLAFNQAILESFQPVMWSKNSILIDCLEKEVGKGSFDLWDYVSRAALDTVCDTIMGGADFDSHDQENSLYFDHVNGLTESIFNRMFTAWYHSDIIFGFSSLYKKMKRELNVVRNTNQKIIDEKRKASSVKPTEEMKGKENISSLNFLRRRKVFLDHLFEINQQLPEFTMQDLSDHVNTFIFAGYDTTSTSTCFTILALALFPDIQDKVYAELFSIFQGSNRPIVSEDLKHMKYLDMVIKEALRMFPIVSLSMRKTEAPIPLEDGRVIPANIFLIMAFIAANRDERHWPNPDKFDPDRFLPENSKNHHPFSHLAFSAGPRNCIGKRYAMMALKTAVASIIRTYQVSTELSEKDFNDVLYKITLKISKGFQIKIEKRK